MVLPNTVQNRQYLIPIFYSFLKFGQTQLMNLKKCVNYKPFPFSYSLSQFTVINKHELLKSIFLHFIVWVGKKFNLYTALRLL